MKLSLTPKRFLNRSKFAFAVLFALTVCIAYPSSNAYAKKRKPAKYGVIKIQTVPAGLPIEVDGKAEGATTSEWRSWNLLQLLQDFFSFRLQENLLVM